MFTQLTYLHYQGAHANEHLWTVSSEEGQSYTIAAALLGNAIVRVRLLRPGQQELGQYQLVDNAQGTLPYHSWMVVKGDEQRPQMQPESSIQDIFAPYLQGFSYSESELLLSRPLADDERIYGCGERTGPMNKRGQAFPIWNVDPPIRHSVSTRTMYTSIPFYLGFAMHSGHASGVLIDHTGLITMDMGQSNEGEVTITLQGDSLVAYFFAGPTPADVMRQYSELTGRMPLPARWTLGHHQCRWGYTSAQVVEEVAGKMRERRHPNDAMWLDIDYMNGYRNFTWNPETFPDPAQFTGALHAQHMHLVTIIDPGTKVDEKYDVYQEAIKNEYACRYPDGRVFTGSVWPGESIFPDFSRAVVRSWWGKLYQKHLDVGVDGIWNDMNEPSLTNFITRKEGEDQLHGATLDENVLHIAGGDQPTDPDGPSVTHTFFHNAYGMEMARSTYEGLLQARPDSRPFVLSRSGTVGLQRYAALWTGDNSSLWEGIPLAISMCLNIGMSGIPFVGADIGGFWGDSNGELLVRFAQLGAFFPFCRNHSALNTAHQEPWAFGESYESAYRTAIETRYQLLPYLYTLFQEASTTGAPVMRPLYYHYPQDEAAVDVEDAFLIGDALLSAPITEPGVTQRAVYLPEGTWLDYWDGTEYTGNTTSPIPAPLDRWPLLVRGNSILPSLPVMQYVDEQPNAPLTFTCYMTTDGLASYTLYEDDGNTQGYRSGAFAKTTVSCRVDADTTTVRIDEHHQGYRPAREEYEVIVKVGNRTLQKRVQAGQGTAIIHL